MPEPTSISILFHERAAVGFALLAASVFRIANSHAAAALYDVRLTGTAERFCWSEGEIRLSAWQECRGGGYLIIPPMEGFTEPGASADAENDLLRDAAANGMVIATACLGAFLPAAAGLLDGREATTHWNRMDYAMDRFPSVRWNLREMLVDHGDIITSGGLLSIVDLCLHIVRKTAGPDCATRLGRILLADTVRQKQSIYATRLVASPKNASMFTALEREIDRRGPDNPTVAEMADFCGMSLRSFHRRFQENYGVSPLKLLQLRKIEKAKALLAETAMSLETIADRAGFADMAFFRNVFARETGMTPGQFRRRLSSG